MTILYWIQVALLALAVVVAVTIAVRISGTRVVVPWRAAVQVILCAAVFAVAFVLAGASSGVVWVVTLLAIGAVIAFMLARGERAGDGTGRPAVRRGALVAWVWAIALMAVVLTLLFGSTFLYGVAVDFMAFALGLVAGQVIGELVKGARRAPVAPPPVLPPPPPPPAGAA